MHMAATITEIEKWQIEGGTGGQREALCRKKPKALQSIVSPKGKLLSTIVLNVFTLHIVFWSLEIPFLTRVNFHSLKTKRLKQAKV